MRNHDIPVAAEGYPFIALSLAVTLVLAFLPWTFTLYLALPALGLTIFIICFFRNPQRVLPDDENAVVAPADGIVIFLGNAPERHTGSEMSKISIFMSVFNVHINRVPFSGRVIDIFYSKGKFHDARDDKATYENEQSGIVLETDKGDKMVFVQVAGLIARRIVSYPRKGDMLCRGDRYGLIRFGSRVDIYLPKGFDLKVAVGDKTVAGETILGTLP
jgi:phosphatidylserine decarboxylase